VNRHAPLIVLLGLAAACAAWAQDETKTEPEKTAPVLVNPAEAIKPGQTSGLPVRSKYLDEIEDGGHETPEEQETLRELPLEAMAAILSALKDMPLEQLEAVPDKTTDFNALMKEPAKHRGSVVQLSGVLQFVQESEIRPNASGLTKCWLGRISTARRRIITFISIEPLPEEMKVGKGVRITGLFYKRYAYSNRDAGGKLTICPLIITPRPVEYSELASGAGGFKFTWLEVVVCFGALVVLCGVLYGRSMRKASSGNAFTRRKELLSGPPTNFPKPDRPPPGPKPDQAKPS